MTWRYFLIVPILAVLALELVLFVRIIAKYRKRFVPLLTLLVIFALNFGFCYALTFLPPLPAHKVVSPPSP